MSRIFNFAKRSAELIKQGVSDEEAVSIMEKEAEESDYMVIDDSDWLSLPDKWAKEAERKYQESLKK